MSAGVQRRYRAFSSGLGFRGEIDSMYWMWIDLSEVKKLREDVRKVACPITLIFNKRRAFSLKLFSVLLVTVFFFPHLTKPSSLSPSLLLSLTRSHCLLFLYYLALHKTIFASYRVKGAEEKGVK